jgi:hypothetical protein
MADLLLFVAAERLLLDEETKNASLIGLLDSLQPTAPKGVTIAAETVVPMAWTIVTLWQRKPGDEGTLFEERVWLTNPDGTPSPIKSELQFEFTNDKQRNTTRILGFPVGQEGDYLLRLALRGRSKSGKWSGWVEHPVAFPVRVSHRVEE